MSEAEVRAEAARFGLPSQDDVEALRQALRSELERLIQPELDRTIEYWNKWIEQNGLPLETYRLW